MGAHKAHKIRPPKNQVVIQVLSLSLVALSFSSVSLRYICGRKPTMELNTLLNSLMLLDGLMLNISYSAQRHQIMITSLTHKTLSLIAAESQLDVQPCFSKRFFYVRFLVITG